MAEEHAAQRVPPHSLSAERSVLGAMMLDHMALSKAAEQLKQEDFYYPANGQMFALMCQLMVQNVPVDAVTLSDYMERKGVLEDAGGFAALAQLSSDVPSAANAVHYIDIIKEYAVLRKLLHATAEIAQRCYSTDSGAAAALQYAEKAIFDISQSDNRRDLVPARQAVNEAYELMEERYEKGEPIAGLPTGFTALDYKLKGMQKAQLIVIGGRSSMGKSAFAMNVVQFAAVYRQAVCAVFSLEMPYQMLAQRMLSTSSNVPLEKIHMGTIADEDWSGLAKAKNELGDTRLFIDDTPGITTMEILSKCRRLKLEYGLDLVMIDYLQLINPGSSSRRESRTLDVAEMTRALKLMARELDVPVIVLSQLSRAVDARGDHRPVLSDLRESGSIEQDADVVMFVYRGSYYNDFSNGTDGEIILAKNRNGPVGSVRVGWNGDTASYVNVEAYRE